MRILLIFVLLFPLYLFAQKPHTVLKLNWGSAAQQAGLRRAPEAIYGPQALQANGDTLWLLDSENRLLKEFVHGRLSGQQKVPPFSDDFYRFSADEYVVLSQNTVYFYNKGLRQSIYRPPTAQQLIQSLRPLTGLQTAVQFSDGACLYFNSHGQAISGLQKGTPVVRTLRRSSDRADIYFNGNVFPVFFAQNNLASVRFLGRDDRGRLFINFELFLQQAPLRIRREIVVFNSRGQRLLTLHVPVNAYTNIFRDTYVDKSGCLFQMMATQQGLEIIYWQLSAYYNNKKPSLIDYPQRFQKQRHYNLLIRPSEVLSLRKTTALEDYPQVLPQDALNVADSYVQLLWNATSGNLTNGVIVDEYGYPVQTPAWIVVGENQKVPYKWGGFENIELFNNGIDILKYAGDNYTDKCCGTASAVGVDCSGFVSRCWNLPEHYSTSMMDDDLTRAYDSWQELEPADAVHKVGHVRLFVQHNGDGSLQVAEASGKDWRVSYRNYYYSDLTDYTPRYYVNRQGAPDNIPQPRMDLVTVANNADLYWSLAGQENTAELRLYTANDGVNWSLTASLADTLNSYSEALPDGQAKYYRMVSVASADGQTESQPSDGYGVYRNDSKSKVLIVDGFDRTSATNGSWTKIYHDFAITHGLALFANEVPFETADNDAVLRGEISLTDYNAVFWLLGDESTHDGSFTKEEQELVRAYLQNGGKLFVSGSEIAWDLDEKGAAYDQDFIHSFLKANYQADDAGSYTVYGESGTNFDGLTLHFDDGSHGVYAVNYPDVIAPQNGSEIALRYASGEVAAVSYQGIFPDGNKEGKLFYMAFPFETIYEEAERNALMEKIVGFFGLDVSSALQTEQDKPQNFILYGNAPNPFNGQTQIRFYLPQAGLVELQVFNVLGQSVFMETQNFTSAGVKRLLFSSKRLSSGLYYYRLVRHTAGRLQLRSAAMLIIK